MKITFRTGGADGAARWVSPVVRRIAILVVLAAVAAVPLASAQDSGDGTPTITGGDPGTTTGSTATTPSPSTQIAAGVTIYGVDVGGMTGEQAEAAVQAAFDEPVQFAWKKRKWWAAPDRLGAKIYVAGAVNRALAAPADPTSPSSCPSRVRQSTTTSRI